MPLSAQSSREDSRKTTLASLAAALAIAAPGGWFVFDASARASWATLGRDQGIFQYVAWAIGEGDVAYRDIRDVNGPLIALVHLLFQALGGTDEHRFRVLDLLFTGLSFAAAGALLPSIRAGAHRGERVAWALAAWVVLSAQYLAYGFWDTAQRESFLDWFVAASLTLQLGAVTTGDPRARRTKLALVVCGAASVLPWFGKPTYVLFTLPQIVAFAIEGEPWRQRLRRVLLFSAGGVAGALGPILFVVLRGDLGRWLRISFVDVPAMYRFIWPRTPLAILSLPYYRTTAVLAVLATTIVVAAIACRALPRRALPIALCPLAGLASMLAQAKGFPYHFHPVTFGTSLAWLAVAAGLWSGLGAEAKARRRRIILRLFVLAGSAVLGVWTARLAAAAPFPEAPAGRDRESLESAARLAPFERIDFFPRALREGADYLAAHTKPSDRVQTYGMDAYVLFLARRRSATPYVYAYDLNAAAALYGSFDEGGPRPTAAQRATIQAMRDAHERDMLLRLERSPPAAFVFLDRSPLMSQPDSVADFAAHCPKTAVWVWTHYREAANFEGVRVWLREDVTSRPGETE